MIRFSNMSRHVIMLMMQFDTILKHVQTCHNAFDAIWYNSRTCLDLYWSSKTSDANWYNSTNLSSFVNMSKLVLNHKMMKYSNIWANGGKKVGNEAIPWTALTSERSKRLKTDKGPSLHYFSIFLDFFWSTHPKSS